jgi:hypothetical protein
LSKGINLPYGDHIVAWSDDKGILRWRERIRLLPFQTRAIVVSVPALMGREEL